MAVVKAVNSRASIGRAVKYVTKDEKTEEKLITGKDCNPFTAIDDMKATKELWGKTGGREYKHYVQSFAEGENVTPELAHKIANEWAEKEFKGYECIIATHTDKGHIHSHVIVNSVNFETGEKFRQSTKWLEQAKEHSDRICAEHGLSITQKGKTFDGQDREDMTAYNKNKYNLIEKADQGKAKSYVYDTALAVMDSKEKATSKDEFIRLMLEKGYRTTWEDSKKHITFENPEGKKVRASNLEKTFRLPFGKESLLHEFEQNARSCEAASRGTEESRDTASRTVGEESRNIGADQEPDISFTATGREPERDDSRDSEAENRTDGKPKINRTDVKNELRTRFGKSRKNTDSSRRRRDRIAERMDKNNKQINKFISSRDKQKELERTRENASKRGKPDKPSAGEKR